LDKSIPLHLKTAYEECQRIAAIHYENFPVASLFLPKENRAHIAALYTFARTADDFADEPPETQNNFFGGSPPAGGEMSIQKWRLKQINDWEKGLKAAFKNKKSYLILQAFAHTLKIFKIPLSLPLNLLKAYRMDLTQKRYKTWSNVLYYCQHSANPVGRMVLYISGIREKKLFRYSDFICTGLQLINFWQDTAVDLSRNRIYYPQTELKKAGVLEKDLLALKDSPSSRVLFKNAVDFTEEYLRKGYPMLKEVPGGLRLELRATYLGGQGILNKIRKMNYDVLQIRPSWSAWDKISLAVKTILGRVTA